MLQAHSPGGARLLERGVGRVGARKCRRAEKATCRRQVPVMEGNPAAARDPQVRSVNL